MSSTSLAMTPVVTLGAQASNLVQLPKTGPSRYQMSGAEIRQRFGDVTPIYKGGARLLRWSNSHASGMSVGIELIEADEHSTHPYKGLRAGRVSPDGGQRLFLSINLRDKETGVILQNIYCGEALLFSWSECCAEGYKVTVSLDNGPDSAGRVHPCDGLATGRKNGETLSMVCWGVADDEAPQPPKRQKRSFDDMPPTSQAHLLCKSAGFFDFLRRNEQRLIIDAIALADIEDLKATNPEQYCECIIKMWCGIESRADFKGETAGAVRARELWAQLRGEYDQDRWGFRR